MSQGVFTLISQTALKPLVLKLFEKTFQFSIPNKNLEQT
jgi:hypothetical protein